MPLVFLKSSLTHFSLCLIATVSLVARRFSHLNWPLAPHPLRLFRFQATLDELYSSLQDRHLEGVVFELILFCQDVPVLTVPVELHIAEVCFAVEVL